MIGIHYHCHLIICQPLCRVLSRPLVGHSVLESPKPYHLCNEQETNRVPQYEQSKLLSLMPLKPSPGAHHMGSQLSAPSCSNVVSYSNSYPLHSNSVPLCLNPGLSHLGPLYSEDDASSNCWSMEHPIMALDIQQPKPSQSSVNKSQPSATGGYGVLSTQRLNDHFNGYGAQQPLTPG